MQNVRNMLVLLLMMCACKCCTALYPIVEGEDYDAGPYIVQFEPGVIQHQLH